MGFNKPVSRKGDRKHFLSCISTSEFLKNIFVNIVFVVQTTVLLKENKFPIPKSKKDLKKSQFFIIVNFWPSY